jgi:TM2 domain-containing membrane protein YozV
MNSPRPDATKYCHACGAVIDVRAEICPNCGVRQPGITAYGDSAEMNRELRNAASKKLAAGLCGVMVGAFGVHKFVLGMTMPGIIMLAVTLGTCFFGAPFMGVLGLVEGIIYLTKSDEEFYETYIVERKEWL